MPCSSLCCVAVPRQIQGDSKLTGLCRCLVLPGLFRDRRLHLLCVYLLSCQAIGWMYSRVVTQESVFRNTFPAPICFQLIVCRLSCYCSERVLLVYTAAPTHIHSSQLGCRTHVHSSQLGCRTHVHSSQLGCRTHVHSSAIGHTYTAWL